MSVCRVERPWYELDPYSLFCISTDRLVRRQFALFILSIWRWVEKKASCLYIQYFICSSVYITDFYVEIFDKFEPLRYQPKPNMTWQTTILCTGSSLSNHTFLEMNKCISFWDASAYRKSYQYILKFKWCLYCEWLGRRPFCSGCIEMISSLLCLIDLPAIVYKWRLTCVLSC